MQNFADFFFHACLFIVYTLTNENRYICWHSWLNEGTGNVFGLDNMLTTLPFPKRPTPTLFIISSFSFLSFPFCPSCHLCPRGPSRSPACRGPVVHRGRYSTSSPWQPDQECLPQPSLPSLPLLIPSLTSFLPSFLTSCPTSCQTSSPSSRFSLAKMRKYHLSI